MQKTLNGVTLKKILLGGAKFLSINREKVDALNVFPVPDGDTGTNMFFTIQNGVKSISDLQINDITELADIFSKGVLLGARGNSGVILSQLFKGFCATIKEAKEVDTKVFSKALQNGTQVAYSVVERPKEGTILTVFKMCADYAMSIYSKNKDFEEFFPLLIEKGEEALALTPELLPVLKKAGVVDAGGMGFMTILKGMYKALIGEEISGEIDVDNKKEETSVLEHADILNLAEIEFAYCTEFFIINLKKKTTLADIDKLREYLTTIGDSVLVIGDLDLVKVHVHTNNPGFALSQALELGELENLKIENMLEQNRKLLAKYKAEKKEMGMLAVCSGAGLKNIFKDLSVDRVLEGGQTMNPSASDIAEQVNRVNADHVFVFPNNSNIILAAEQAKAFAKSKTIHVIPTKSIPQGITAALAFAPDISVEENKIKMLHALEEVVSAQVTFAIKDAEVDGVPVTTGDCMGMMGKKLIAKGTTVPETVKELVEKLVQPSHSLVNLYYGEDVTDEEAENLQAELQEKYEDLEVSCLSGGQPVYSYLISLE